MADLSIFLIKMTFVL
jgi:hypothetical protein